MRRLSSILSLWLSFASSCQRGPSRLSRRKNRCPQLRPSQRLPISQKPSSLAARPECGGLGATAGAGRQESRSSRTRSRTRDCLLQEWRLPQGHRCPPESDAGGFKDNEAINCSVCPTISQGARQRRFVSREGSGLVSARQRRRFLHPGCLLHPGERLSARPPVVCAHVRVPPESPAAYLFTARMLLRQEFYPIAEEYAQKQSILILSFRSRTIFWGSSISTNRRSQKPSATLRRNSP